MWIVNVLQLPEMAGAHLFWQRSKIKRLLCTIVQDRLHMDPRRCAVYLFCGKRCDRIKALYWEGDGFLLLYKRMEAQGRFRWPRDSDEARQLTWQQFDWLMSGLEIEQLKAFRLPENVDNVPA